MSEQSVKELRIRNLLESKGLDALAVRGNATFSWATCGASGYIDTSTDRSQASLLYTLAGRYIVTTNIEAPRLEKEEGLADQGWEIITEHWYEQGSALQQMTQGLKLGSDLPYPHATDLSADLSVLRAQLIPEEGERYRELCHLCAEAMNAAIHRVRPEQTEHEIAAILAEETEARGAWPTVDLIATDERVYEFRHPLPTNKKLDRYAMLVLCGRKWGLVASITRLVHFGAIPDDLRHKQEAVARVDSAIISATRPHAVVGDIFSRAIQMYTEVGYPDEWQLHHQGGAAGYMGREYFATPASQQVVSEGQVFAWNPSITGYKSEDTIIVNADVNEVMTAIPDWPTIRVGVDGTIWERPAILEV